MSEGARVVFGAPLYNHANHLPEAIESILGQTFPNLALVLADDLSSDATPQVAGRYAARDTRVAYTRNEQRLGYIGNARRVFELARQLHPRAEYFAWASDHDVWHPRWVEALVRALDDAPEAVLAYPIDVRMSDDGEFHWKTREFDTLGVRGRRKRFALSFDKMAAGSVIYGLFRISALEKTGLMAPVLLPDRFLLAQLALHGSFRQVPEVLWYRRYWGIASLERQRAAFFPYGAPRYAYLPWWLPHVALLWGKYVWRGEGEPEITRREGIWITWTYLWRSMQLVTLRSLRQALGGWFKGARRGLHRLRKSRQRLSKLRGRARKLVRSVKGIRSSEDPAWIVPRRLAVMVLGSTRRSKRLRRVRRWVRAHVIDSLPGNRARQDRSTMS